MEWKSALTQWNRRNVPEHAAIDCSLLFCLRFVSCAEKQQSRALCQLSALFRWGGKSWLNERANTAEGDPPLTPARRSQGGERPCPQCDNSFTLQHEAYSSTQPPLRTPPQLKWLHTGNVLFWERRTDGLFPASPNSEAKLKSTGGFWQDVEPDWRVLWENTSLAQFVCNRTFDCEARANFELKARWHKAPTINSG